MRKDQPVMSLRAMGAKPPRERFTSEVFDKIIQKRYDIC